MQREIRAAPCAWSQSCNAVVTSNWIAEIEDLRHGPALASDCDIIANP